MNPLPVPRWALWDWRKQDLRGGIGHWMDGYKPLDIEKVLIIANDFRYDYTDYSMIFHPNFVGLNENDWSHAPSEYKNNFYAAKKSCISEIRPLKPCSGKKVVVMVDQREEVFP